MGRFAKATQTPGGSQAHEHYLDCGDIFTGMYLGDSLANRTLREAAY